jgi:hypothetical protein
MSREIVPLQKCKKSKNQAKRSVVGHFLWELNGKTSPPVNRTMPHLILSFKFNELMCW